MPTLYEKGEFDKEKEKEKDKINSMHISILC